MDIQRRLSHTNIVQFRGACCEYADSQPSFGSGGTGGGGISRGDSGVGLGLDSGNLHGAGSSSDNLSMVGTRREEWAKREEWAREGVGVRSGCEGGGRSGCEEWM